VRNGPIDIVMLTHDRLEHLVATVDALEARTPEPYRLTIVDNASGPAVRNWLGENRRRFHRLIMRPTNEHVPAFTHGIAATVSDPFVVTDPDVIVPALEPSWLSRMLELVERHPDFGLIGVGLEQVNRPAVLGPHVIDPATVVNGELVEAGTGTVFQFIRRDALVTSYRSDGQACTTVQRAGYRVGWSSEVRALHIGWDDFRLYPGHLLSKPRDYGVYREIDLVRRPPTLEELALAGPLVAETRRAGVPDTAVLALAWDGQALGASVPEVLALAAPELDELPLDEGAAGAVVLELPPKARAGALVRECCRVSAKLVVAVAPLDTFDATPAAELAPPGWRGREARAVGDVPLAVARAAAADPALAEQVHASTAEDRERWLELFAVAGFGKGELRLWIWEREQPLPVPSRVGYDPALVTAWQPGFMAAPAPERVGRLRRLWRRVDLHDRAEVWLGRLRRRRRRG
jgi:Glycosyl transferase family 2